MYQVEIHQLSMAVNCRMMSDSDKQFIRDFGIFDYPIKDSIAILDAQRNLRAFVFAVGSPVGPVVQTVETYSIDGKIFPDVWWVATSDQLGTDERKVWSLAEAWDQMNEDFARLTEAGPKL